MFSFYTEKNEAENLEENEEPFIAPLGLNVPPDVELVCMLPVHGIAVVITGLGLYLCKSPVVAMTALQVRNAFR